MSDNSASDSRSEPELTMEEIIAAVQPMGDLRRFRIEDLTPEEEDEFFAVLDSA